MTPIPENALFRVLDANFNRLREGLRVVEEYFRFISSDENHTEKLKELRHVVKSVELSIDLKKRLEGRDTESDPFSRTNRPEELERTTLESVLMANIKRAQEASRVLEEYLKISDTPSSSETMKQCRFTLYHLEKQLFGLEDE